MKKIILVSISCWFLTSCSFLPKLNFGNISTVPQSTEKSQRTTRCSRDIVLDEHGKVKSCNKGFSQNESFYNKQERKLTIRERVANFIRNLSSSLFWIFIFMLIFMPSALGWLVGRIFNGTGRALESTVRAVSRAKNNGGNYLDELKKEHHKKPDVQKIINRLRAKISTEE